MDGYEFDDSFFPFSLHFIFNTAGRQADRAEMFNFSILPKGRLGKGSGGGQLESETMQCK